MDYVYSMYTSVWFNSDAKSLLIQEDSNPLINVLTKRAMGLWCAQGWLESLDRGLRPEWSATREPMFPSPEALAHHQSSSP